MLSVFKYSRRIFQNFSPLKQKKLDEILRVDHAGEVAAVRIAATQLFLMSPLDDAVPIVKEILSDEIHHRHVMNELVQKYGVRTTLLNPFFKFGALAMGGCTALLGKESMMCCHAAVERTIFNHYNAQLRAMELLDEQEISTLESKQDEDNWNTLKDYIAKFRDEEKHHQELGENNGAQDAPLYHFFYNGIQVACKLGIQFAQRI